MRLFLLSLLCVSGILHLNCGGGATTPAIGILSTFPSGRLGAPGTTAQFSVGTTTPAVAWQWTFGGGATTADPTSATPVVTLGAPGSYTGTVAVTGQDGGLANRSFSYTVHAVDAPASLQLSVFEATGPTDIEPFIQVHNERFWITSSDPVTRQLRISEALVAAPSDATDWRRHTVAATKPIRFSTTLQIIQNRPVAVLIAEDGDVQIARALVAIPTSSADWHVMSLGDSGDFAADVFVIEHLGRLTVSWWGGDPDAPTPVEIRQALVADPREAEDWLAFVLDSTAHHYPVDLAILNEQLVVAYAAGNGSPKIAISQPALPVSAASFDFHSPDPDDNVDGPDAHLAVVQNRLLLLYHQDTGILSCARALVDRPAGPTDYQIHNIDTGARPNARNAIAVIDNRLAFSYIDTDNRRLKVIRSRSASPSRAEDWEIRVVDNAAHTGRYSGIAATATHIGVVYMDEANLQLKWALGMGTW